jgi:DNA-binding response OmpR family regulator
MKTFNLKVSRSGVTKTALFKRILLIEKDSKLANEIHEMLDEYMIDVTTVHSGSDAVRLLMEREYDLLLCDVTDPSLPVKTFFETLQRIWPGVAKRTISITDSRHSHLSLGAMSVWKPLDLQFLWEAIEYLMAKPDTRQGKAFPGNTALTALSHRDAELLAGKAS